MNKNFKVVIGSQYEEIEDIVIELEATSKYEAIFLATQQIADVYIETNKISIEDDSVIVSAYNL